MWLCPDASSTDDKILLSCGILRHIVLLLHYIASYCILYYISILTTLLFLSVEFSSLPFNHLSHPISSFLSFSSSPLFNILAFLSYKDMSLV